MSFNLPEGAIERPANAYSEKMEPRTCPFKDEDFAAFIEVEWISGTVYRETWDCGLCGFMHSEDLDSTEDGL